MELYELVIFDKELSCEEHREECGIGIFIVNDIIFRTLMSEVCCYADERLYLKVQILMSFTIHPAKKP